MHKATNWTEKYRPIYFTDIKGQEQAVEKIKDFLQKSEKRKKAVILHGPPGTGKTALAYVIANETKSEIFELNASDFRNKKIFRRHLENLSARKACLAAGN